MLEGYLQELFRFTIESYKTLNPSIQFHASTLNQVWTRIYTESIAMTLPGQEKIEELIEQIIATFLEETIKVQGMSKVALSGDESEGEDEDENFQKKERTQKNENLDFFARLMKQKIQYSCNIILTALNSLL